MNDQISPDDGHNDNEQDINAGSPDAAVPDAPKPAQAMEAAELDALEMPVELSGRMLAHYTVGERLGGGAMAAVYRAEDMRSGQPVALKVLLSGADSVMRERFRREARTVRGLAHPHIVRTLAVGESQSTGTSYIAMELVEGSSLAQLLEQYGKLSPGDACRLLAPIADALAHAHAQGFVHRDVKPSNILLRRATAGESHAVWIEGTAYSVVPLLSDFGIARALDAPELTSAGRTIGTPAFMAPEQCAGSDEIDGRADVYALGAVLYRCIIGRAPFAGTTTQILHAHVYEPLLVPDNVAQQLAGPVLAMLAQSMMKEPDQRYADIGQLAKEMARCAELAEAGQGDIPEPLEDATRTLASLPVTGPGTTETARVLVPAPERGARRIEATQPTTPQVSPEPAIPRTPLQNRIESGVDDAAHGRGRRTRLGIWALGAALSVLVILLAGMLVNSAFQGTVLGDRGLGTPTETAGNGGSDDQGAPDTDDVAVTGADPAQPVSDGSGTGSGSETRPSSTRAGPTPAPTEAPAPSVPLESAWEEAQVFFEEREWDSARDWLIIVRRIDEEFERERVEEMLVTAYLGLASEETLRGQFDEALAKLEAALELQPNNEIVESVYNETSALRLATDEERTEAREALQAAYLASVRDLREDAPCLALEQAGIAFRILATQDILSLQADLREACDEQQNVETFASLSGAIVYSAEQGGQYRIFHQPIANDLAGVGSSAQVLLDDASQPRVSPDRGMLAFFNRGAEGSGLFGISLTQALTPQGGRIQYSEFVEDARDAPPVWNADSDRLVFSSTSFGDGRNRVYVTSASQDRSAATLGYGKDPAWHPQQNLIVFNGTDETGEHPGLWTMQTSGERQGRLTDNGNDQRPVWTPDGRHVVFMSNGRDGNWELYRVDVAELSVQRLTNNAAQDGLPAVSPDGEYVAFMSDRDGYWRLYYVPLDGGEERVLGDVSGQLPNWLEHAVQWVN